MGARNQRPPTDSRRRCQPSLCIATAGSRTPEFPPQRWTRPVWCDRTSVSSSAREARSYSPSCSNNGPKQHRAASQAVAEAGYTNKGSQASTRSRAARCPKADAVRSASLFFCGAWLTLTVLVLGAKHGERRPRSPDANSSGRNQCSGTIALPKRPSGPCNPATIALNRAGLIAV